MPGYEVYRADGFLLLRIRRADWSPIPQKELESVASQIDKAADPKTFIIRALGPVPYEKSKEDQVGLGFPKADGSRMSKEQFESEHAAIKARTP
jgi:hypothetical protein